MWLEGVRERKAASTVVSRLFSELTQRPLAQQALQSKQSETAAATKKKRKKAPNSKPEDIK